MQETIQQPEGGAAVRSIDLLGEHRKPINRDAVKILRRVSPATLKTEWTKADEEASRWAGIISKCPSCGDRAYEHGYCFGCGRPLAASDGIARSPNTVLADEKAALSK
jgi:ribosomal protein L32